MALLALILVACSSTDSPTLQLSSDKTAYYVGERARLHVSFTEGSGRIYPDIGPVMNNEFVLTPVLSESRQYRLIVETPDGSVFSRNLLLPVGFRDRWQTLRETFSVAYHLAVTAVDGSVLIIGGDRGQTTLSSDIHRYDPLSQTFSKVGNLNSGRASFTATRLNNGQILLAGGEISLTGAPNAELVNESTGAVEVTGSLIQPRQGHAAVLLNDGRVLVVGGSNLNTLEIWTPASNQWHPVTATMAHAREHPSASLLDDGRVLIVGGFSSSPSYVFAEIFDPQSETLAPVQTNLIHRRYLHTAHRQDNGSVIIIGGEVFENSHILPQAGVLRFNPQSLTFSDAAPLQLARSLIPAVSVPGDRIFLAGGMIATQPATNATSLYASGGEYGTSQPMPEGRVWHSVSHLHDGRLLVVGGESASGQLRPVVFIYE